MGQFSYNKLWKILIDRNMTKEELRLKIKASPNTIAAIGKGEGISLALHGLLYKRALTHYACHCRAGALLPPLGYHY